MEAYTDFASVYDLFMEDVPYEEWAQRIVRLIDEHDRKQVPDGDEVLASEAGLMVDLGCGTGVMTALLREHGFDMIGIDSSIEMLEKARTRVNTGDGDDALFLCQDMRELELYSTVGTVISVCDCINYLLEESDILDTFKLVENYLYPGGLFIFDFNTIHKYRDVIGDATIAENREEGSFIWENYFDEETGINEYDLTLYVKDNSEDGMERFVRSQETHTQRGYEATDIEKLIKEAGLELVLMLDADTDESVEIDTERVLVVARKQRETWTE